MNEFEKNYEEMNVGYNICPHCGRYSVATMEGYDTYRVGCTYTNYIFFLGDVSQLFEALVLLCSVVQRAADRSCTWTQATYFRGVPYFCGEMGSEHNGQRIFFLYREA